MSISIEEIHGSVQLRWSCGKQLYLTRYMDGLDGFLLPSRDLSKSPLGILGRGFTGYLFGLKHQPNLRDFSCLHNGQSAHYYSDSDKQQNPQVARYCIIQDAGETSNVFYPRPIVLQGPYGSPPYAVSGPKPVFFSQIRAFLSMNSSSYLL